MDDHNHDMPTHSMKCPDDACDYIVKIHAHDDNEAVSMMTDTVKAHYEIAHADKPTRPEELNEYIRENMTKESV